jgi:hypothetical protein
MAIMRHILLIFLDGIGLGDDDPATNPFAVANTPTLHALANGKRWLRETGVQHSERAVFVPTDANMSIPGKPQSASGQATILTGRDVPGLIGEHYGPRPNEAIRAILHQDNFFKQVIARGMTAALLEGYPPRWHDAVNRGKRLRSSYQESAHSAGVQIFTEREIYSGDALGVDWTGEGWRRELGYTDSPVYSPFAAGAKMVELAQRYNFAFFPHWITDTLGHRGTVAEGVQLLEMFDGVMAGALANWRDDEGLIIITSDHGNFEDMSHTKHTENAVPTVIIGSGKEAFADGLRSLADLTPHMAAYLFA